MTDPLEDLQDRLLKRRRKSKDRADAGLPRSSRVDVDLHYEVYTMVAQLALLAHDHPSCAAYAHDRIDDIGRLYGMRLDREMLRTFAQHVANLKARNAGDA